MQDVEFTIERGKLWMLQTRNGKRTAKAAVKIAVDMANEGLISKEEAVTPRHARTTSTRCCTRSSTRPPRRMPRSPASSLAKGVNASPGAAVGQAYFDADTGREDGEGSTSRTRSWSARSPSRMTCTA